MIALSLLETAFIIVIEPGRRHRVVESLAEAQGVQFLCPACFEKNHGPVGTHCCLCWFSDHGVSDDEVPTGGRWVPSGAGLEDLSLSPSIMSPSDPGCAGWHGFLEQGKVRIV